VPRTVALLPGRGLSRIHQNTLLGLLVHQREY